MRTPHPPTRPALRLHTHTHTPSARRAAVPTFCNGRQLRDYQLKSLEWNVINWWTARNCILGDEASRQRSLSYIPAPPPLPQPATTHPLTRQPTHPRTRPPTLPPPPSLCDRWAWARPRSPSACWRGSGSTAGRGGPFWSLPPSPRWATGSARSRPGQTWCACVRVPACLPALYVCVCVCVWGG